MCRTLVLEVSHWHPGTMGLLTGSAILIAASPQHLIGHNANGLLNHNDCAPSTGASSFDTSFGAAADLPCS